MRGGTDWRPRARCQRWWHDKAGDAVFLASTQTVVVGVGGGGGRRQDEEGDTLFLPSTQTIVKRNCEFRRNFPLSLTADSPHLPLTLPWTDFSGRVYHQPLRVVKSRSG